MNAYIVDLFRNTTEVYVREVVTEKDCPESHWYCLQI